MKRLHPRTSTLVTAPLTLSVETTFNLPLFSHLQLLGTMRELNTILKAMQHFLIKKNDANLCVQYFPVFQKISHILASEFSIGCEYTIRYHYIQVHLNFIIGWHIVNDFKRMVLCLVDNMYSGCA